MTPEQKHELEVWEKQEETKKFIIYTVIIGGCFFIVTTFFWHFNIGLFKSLFYAGTIIVIHKYERINMNISGLMYFLLFLSFLLPYAHSN